MCTQKHIQECFEYHSYKNFDANSFNEDLRNVPWHVVDNENNIDDALLTWNKLFSEVADDHAPVKRRRVNGTPLPWMNSKISESMRDRDWYHRKARKSNSEKHWNTYRKLRNKVNRLVKSAKSKYYCEMIEEARGDHGKTWKAVNEAAIVIHPQKRFSASFPMAFSTPLPNPLLRL